MRQFPHLTEEQKKTPAGREAQKKTWTVLLQCFSCKRRFAVRRATMDRLPLTPYVACLHCGAEPSSSPFKQLHLLLDMRDDSREPRR
jgi:hypothetical protein